ITPEYLKTPEDQRVTNYRDWGIQLGRRFRALKLWFVLRHFGIEGLQQKIRNHISLAAQFKQWITAADDFELLAPVPLNVVCFRYHPASITDEKRLNQLNKTLLGRLQQSGKLFVTHTLLNGTYTIRMVIGNTRVQRKHVDKAWERIQNTAVELLYKE